MSDYEPLLNLPCDNRNWYNTVTSLDAFNDCASTNDLKLALKNLYKAADFRECMSERRYLKMFEGLYYFLDKHASETERLGFFNVILPTIARRTSCMACVQRPSPTPIRMKNCYPALSRIELSDDLVASLVCASFLGLLPPSNPNVSCNLSSTFRHLQDEKEHNVHFSSLRKLLDYLESLADENTLSSNIVYSKINLSNDVTEKSTLDEWKSSLLPLCQLSIHSVSPPGHAHFHIANRETLPHLAVLTNLLYDKIEPNRQKNVIDVIKTLGDKREIFVLLDDNVKQSIVDQLEQNYRIFVKKAPLKNNKSKSRSVSPSAFNLEHKFVRLDAFAGDIAQHAVYDGVLEAQNILMEAYNIYLFRRSSSSSSSASISGRHRNSRSSSSNSSSYDAKQFPSRRTSSVDNYDSDSRRRSSAASKISLDSFDFDQTQQRRRFSHLNYDCSVDIEASGNTSQSNYLSTSPRPEVIKEEPIIVEPILLSKHTLKPHKVSSNRTDSEKLFKHSVSSLVDDMLAGAISARQQTTDDEKSVVFSSSRRRSRQKSYRIFRQGTFEKQLNEFCHNLVKRSMLSARAELEIEFRPTYFFSFADMFVKRILDDALVRSLDKDATLKEFHMSLVAVNPNSVTSSPIADFDNSIYQLQLENQTNWKNVTKLRRSSTETLLSSEKWKSRKPSFSVHSSIDWFVQDLLIESFDSALIDLFGPNWDWTSTDLFRQKIENWSSKFIKHTMGDALKTVYTTVAKKKPSKQKLKIERLSACIFQDAFREIVRNTKEAKKMPSVVIHVRKEGESIRTLLKWAAASRAGVTNCYIIGPRQLLPNIRAWQRKYNLWSIGQLVSHLSQIEYFDNF